MQKDLHFANLPQDSEVPSIEPLTDHLLVRREEKALTTRSGIVLPDSTKRGPTVKGLVLAVGPGLLSPKGVLQPLPLSPGETVLFAFYSGNDVPLDGDEDSYVVLRECDVLGVVKEGSYELREGL